jgi:predicted Zn-dependent protease
VAAVALLVAAVVSVPYLSTRELVQAGNERDSAQALDRLKRSSEINPFSVEPLLVRATLLIQLGRGADAVAAAREAIDRNPNDWTAWVTLADALSAVGDGAGSNAARARAKLLNPLGSVIS